MGPGNGDSAQRLQTDRPGPARRSLWALVFLSVGLVLAREAPLVGAATWFALACGAIAAAGALRGGACKASLAAAVVLASAGWMNVRTGDWPPGSLARAIGPGGIFDTSRAPDPRGPALALEGLVLDDPAVFPPGRWSQDLPWTPGPATMFTLDVHYAGPHDQEGIAVRGRVPITVRGEVTGVRAGAFVRVLAQVQPMEGPLNPGEEDARPWARQDGIAARGLVDGPLLVVPSDGDFGWVAAVRAWACRALVEARAVAASALSDALQSDTDHERIEPTLNEQGRATMRALLLGRYDPDVREVSDAFRRLGLLHALAISGFHLSLLAYWALWLVRATGERGRWEPAIVAAMVLVYLLIVPAEAPVVRAGLMALGLLAAEAAGRRYDRLSVLGWVGCVLLIWRPMDLWSMGFQLSWGVTGALLWLGPRVHAEWFGGERVLGGYERSPRVWSTLWRGNFGAAVSSCVLAWAVATPLIAWHTGAVSTVGWLTSVLMVVPVAAAMVAGYAALIIGAALGWIPGVAECAGHVIDAVGAGLAWLVLRLDELPGTVWMLPKLPAAWTLGATGVVLAVMWTGRRIGAGGWLAGAGIALWLMVILAASAGLPSGQAARVDVLAVGEGPCVLIRSGEHATLVDGLIAPGSSAPTAARRVHRAARELGVWRVRTVVVRGTDAMRLGAIPLLVEPLGIRDVLVSESMAALIHAHPAGPAARWARRVEEAGARLRTVRPGERLVIGHAQMEFEPAEAGRLWLRAEVADCQVLLLGAEHSDSARTVVAAMIETAAPMGKPATGSVVVSSRKHGAGRNDGAWPWRDGAWWMTMGMDGRQATGTLRGGGP